MGSKLILARSRQPLVAALFAFSIPLALAQTPTAGSGDELRATMRVMGPGTDNPDAILRKIPPPKPKQSKNDDDAPAKDLAKPGTKDDDSGSAVDPEAPGEPLTPAVPDSPAEPGSPIDPDPPYIPDPIGA